MLYLLFNVKRDAYAVEVGRLVEVVPWVPLRAIAKAPRFVAGLLNYRGQAVPVIDLCAQMFGEPSAELLSSRIMVVTYVHRGMSVLLGMLAEHVTETLECDPQKFQALPMNSDEAPYLREFIPYREHLVQRIEIDALLSDKVHALLFK